MDYYKALHRDYEDFELQHEKEGRYKTMKRSRAELAGRARARSIVEDTELLYNENTKRNYLRGVIAYLNEQGKKVTAKND